MASFVIHHAAGKEFLKQLESNYGIKLTENQKNNFLLGNLIVDSSKINFNIIFNLPKGEQALLKSKYDDLLQEEKISTHFRNLEDKDMFVQMPVLEKFIEKYDGMIKIYFSVLGYLFHLYTDKMFFGKLFTDSFDCLDENNQKTNYNKDIQYIRVKKDNQIYLQSDIFNKQSNYSIYTDYTIMNKIILDYFKLSSDFEELYNFARSEFINPGIDEVDFKNIIKVLDKTVKYITQSNFIQFENLTIFDVEKIKLFIPSLVESFINEFKEIIDEIIKKNDNLVLKK